VSIRRHGFTVLEAAVALTIIGMSSLGVLSAFGAHTRGALQVRERLEASALAQDVLARIRLVDAVELSPLPDSLARGAFGAPFAAYAWTARVTPVAGEWHLYEVTVRVTSGEAEFVLRSRRFAPPASVDAR
jgi:type II secretory pathway pseudopilin PulG